MLVPFYAVITGLEMDRIFAIFILSSLVVVVLRIPGEKRKFLTLPGRLPHWPAWLRCRPARLPRGDRAAGALCKIKLELQLAAAASLTRAAQRPGSDGFDRFAGQLLDALAGAGRCSAAAANVRCASLSVRVKTEQVRAQLAADLIQVAADLVLRSKLSTHRTAARKTG